MIKTRANIIEAFWQIYQGKRIDKITIKELMDKAGYHRSVFYSYFRDIYDLLEQEKESIFMEMDEFLPYINKILLDDKYDKVYFEKIERFSLKYSSKLYTLSGPYGDFDFQCKMREHIRENLYNVFNLPKNNCKINLAMEFFVNGHMSTMLYYYKHRDALNINDYFNLIKPILNIFFKYKRDV